MGMPKSLRAVSGAPANKAPGAGCGGARRFRYSDLNEAARIRGYMGFESGTELGRRGEYSVTAGCVSRNGAESGERVPRCARRRSRERPWRSGGGTAGQGGRRRAVGRKRLDVFAEVFIGLPAPVANVGVRRR